VDAHLPTPFPDPLLNKKRVFARVAPLFTFRRQQEVDSCSTVMGPLIEHSREDVTSKQTKSPHTY